MSFGLQKNPGSTAKSPYDFQGITVRTASRRQNLLRVPTNKPWSPEEEDHLVLLPEEWETDR